MDERGTQTLTEAVGQAIDAALLEVRVCVPGRVEDYDPDQQRATVTPLLLRKTSSGDLLSPKPIANVPVLHTRAGGFSLTLPVVSGDVGLLLCSDRSLDLWLESSGDVAVDPQSRRHHQLTDAVFLPGLRSWSAVPAPPAGTDPATDLVLSAEDGDCWISVRADGEVRIKGSAVRVGDPAATTALALATLVDSRLAALVTALNTHVHAGVTVGAGVTGVATPTASQASVAASKVFGG